MASLPLALGLVIWANPIGLFRVIAHARLALAGLDSQTIPAPRGTLHFWEGGDAQKPTIVLIHGLGNDAGIWASTAKKLRGDYRVLVPDLPAHGESSPRGTSRPLKISMADEVAGIEALLDARAANQKVILVGNSLGGWTAMLLAEQRPERISRLVLVDSAGLFYVPKMRYLVRNRKEGRTLVDALLGPKIPRLPDFVIDDFVEKLQEGAAPPLWDSFRRQDFLDDSPERLPALKTPADVIWGEADELFPLEVGRQLANHLAAGRFHSIPECGHAPQGECPKAFNEKLLWVLKEPPPPETVEVGEEGVRRSANISISEKGSHPR